MEGNTGADTVDVHGEVDVVVNAWILLSETEVHLWGASIELEEER